MYILITTRDYAMFVVKKSDQGPYSLYLLSKKLVASNTINLLANI